MKKKAISTQEIVALGAGAVALAASTYYLFGPEGKIHRKKAVGWMLKIKGEIIDKIEEAGEITEEAYHGIIDTVLASYLATDKITAPELKKFADDLKGQWKSILKTLPKKQSKTSRSAKKVV